MTKPYLLIPFLFFASLLSAQTQAVQVTHYGNCDSRIISQVDSIKKLYAADGFLLLKEAAITMESEYELPVIVPLNEGSWYQFVFIGEYTSRLYEVRMYDWNERMVVFQQKRWGDVDGNVISYAYQPKFSEFHMIKPVQVNKEKKKNLCGYVMMFKKTGNTN
ncbi:MAG: hypothetical protein GC171_14335 [Terrimonas sp.]|nr:hypothetical protein [Terrimonas sp.]